MGWRAGVANLVTVGFGPCLAALVRRRRFAWSTERVLVIVSVVLGMAVGLSAGAYAVAYHDRIRMQPLSGTAGFLEKFAHGVPPAVAGSAERLPVSPAFRRFRGM